MNHFMKKTIGLILSCGIAFSSFGSVSALAADSASSRRPSVTYGTTFEFGKTEFLGPWKDKKWNY